MVNKSFWDWKAYLTTVGIYQTGPLNYLKGGFRCVKSLGVLITVGSQRSPEFWANYVSQERPNKNYYIPLYKKFVLASKC